MAEVKRQTKPPIIEVKDFDFYYNGGSKKVLKDINMKIKEKTVTAFIGPSGCGKSTLLRSINRMNDLVPNIVVDGELFFNEKNIYDPGVDVTRLRTDIGMVFQKANPFPMSIFDNVAFGPRSQGIKDKKILNEIVEDALKKSAL
jgi:phosphate transport system ATP-binding protein